MKLVGRKDKSIHCSLHSAMSGLQLKYIFIHETAVSKSNIRCGKIAKFFWCFFCRKRVKKWPFFAYNMHITRTLYHKVCTMSARCPHDRCSEGALFLRKTGVNLRGKIAKFFTCISPTGEHYLHAFRQRVNFI